MKPELTELRYQEDKLFDTHGADNRQWPPDVRERFAQLQDRKRKLIRQQQRQERRKDKRLAAGRAWAE